MKDKTRPSFPDGSDPRIVGENIRDLRRRAHLSQGDLARRLKKLKITVER